MKVRIGIDVGGTTLGSLCGSGDVVDAGKDLGENSLVVLGLEGHGSKGAGVGEGHVKALGSGDSVDSLGGKGHGNREGLDLILVAGRKHSCGQCKDCDELFHCFE